MSHGDARAAIADEGIAPIVERGWLQSGAVAKLFGMKTGTLKKWRAAGKGPRGWKRVAPTVVMYPVTEVVRFHERWQQASTNNK